jgi:hypothetical protein
MKFFYAAGLVHFLLPTDLNPFHRDPRVHELPSPITETVIHIIYLYFTKVPQQIDNAHDLADLEIIPDFEQQDDHYNTLPFGIIHCITACTNP